MSCSTKLIRKRNMDSCLHFFRILPTHLSRLMIEINRWKVHSCILLKYSEWPACIGFFGFTPLPESWYLFTVEHFCCIFLKNILKWLARIALGSSAAISCLLSCSVLPLSTQLDPGQQFQDCWPRTQWPILGAWTPRRRAMPALAPRSNQLTLGS